MLNYRIAEAAARDIEALAVYTAENFGELALDRYLKLLDVTLTKLREHPDSPGIQHFSDRISKCPLSLWREAARTPHGIVKHPRHILYFQIANDGVLEIVRVLHDSMDAQKHLPEESR